MSVQDIQRERDRALESEAKMTEEIIKLCDENDTLKKRLSGIDGVSTSSTPPSSPSSSSSTLQQKLQGEVDALKRELSDTLQKLNSDGSGAELKAVKKALKESNMQVERLQTDARKNEQELNFYKAMKHQDLDSSTHKQFQEKIQELEVRLKATLGSLAKAHVQLSKMDAASDEIKELNDQIEEIRTTSDRLKISNNAKDVELDDLRMIIEQLEEEANECKEKASSGGVCVDSSRDRIAELECALQTSNESVSLLNITVENLKGEKLKLCEDVDSLKKLQEKCAFNVKEATDTATSKLNETIEKLLEEKNGMDSEICSLRKQLNKATSDIQKTLQGQLEAEVLLEDARRKSVELESQTVVSGDMEGRKRPSGSVEAPSSPPFTSDKFQLDGLQEREKEVQTKNEELMLSAGQKELVESIIFNLKAEIVTLKNENASLRELTLSSSLSSTSSHSSSPTFDTTALIVADKPSMPVVSCIEGGKGIVASGASVEEELRIFIANLEHEKEYLEVSTKDLQSSLSEKELALAVSMEHAAMLRQVISQLERTHMHVDSESAIEHPVDFNDVKNNIKIATYHANYLGALCNKREVSGEGKKDGDDIVHSLIDNIDALDSDIHGLQVEWISREKKLKEQNDLLEMLKRKLDQRVFSSKSISPAITPVGASSPMVVTHPGRIGGSADRLDQDETTSKQLSPIAPPSPSVPPSPSIRLLMEMHEQLDQELLEGNDTPPNISGRLNLSNVKSEEFDRDRNFSPSELNSSMQIVDASFSEMTNKTMIDLRQTIKNLEASNVERDMQIAERDAQIEYFTEEITKLEAERRQFEAKVEKPFGTALIEKVDKINADWIETEDQSEYIGQLRDEVMALSAQIDMKEHQLYESGEKLVEFKELSKETLSQEVKRSQKELKQQADNYDFRIRDLEEEILILQIEVVNLRHFSDVATMIDSANQYSKSDTRKVDLTPAKEELDRLQTQLAVLQQNKMSESEKHLVLSQVYQDADSASVGGKDKAEPRRSPSRDGVIMKQPLSKSPKRALTAEEAAMQIAARNNSRSATRLISNGREYVSDGQLGNEGALITTTPRDIRVKQEQDCAVAMGCSPS